MILADTSVWIDHWRRGNPRLAELLTTDRVVIHPFIIGELSLGALNPRAAVLEDLRALRIAPLAEDAEVAGLIERRKLWGRGLGWVDAHLVASTLLAGVKLWTLDRALERVARRLAIAV